MTGKARRGPRRQLPPGELYETPADCVRGLLEVETFAGRIWEPAAGRGAIVRELDAAGLGVVGTDLLDHGGFFETGRDFLAERELLAPNIITNPPFSLAEEFATHGLRLGARKVALFLRLAFLEGDKRRRGIFAEHPPARVWVLSKRRTLWRGDEVRPDDGHGMVAFAWFVWERAHRGAVIGWIP
jgi:hypothetical protein